MKILLIYSSAGAGHMKAAEAVYHGLQKQTSHQVVLVDALDYTSPALKNLYRQTYFCLISQFPWAWGFFFSWLDQDWMQPLVRFIRRLYNGLIGRALVHFLEKEKFDVIVSTHFLPTEVSGALKRSERITSKLITIITDFDVHKIWTARGVDGYCVASPWTKEKLKKLGVEDNNIFVTGIPTDEKFFKHPDIGALKRKLGLREDLFTILVATGSFGIGPIEKIVDALNNYQVLVICGHNKDLCVRLSPKASANVKIYPLVENMNELMAVSDCMVTKPGGLSIAEALVSQLPLIFFNAIPGQETNNIKVLKRHGIGAGTQNIDEIVAEIKRLSSSKDAHVSALKRTRELARPNAVPDIIQIINNQKKEVEIYRN